ncbi:hypothetical protein PLICRDRAFT_419566 [Plicaturopsis crispa FD-325 SS-3]|nr:hypothetical protein PLICRDRAFT_419566 [Plicaturopsis crispa FD-325 SS-3]
MGVVSDGQKHVRVWLVDWASELQIKHFVLAMDARISPPTTEMSAVHQFLFIGDSITSGFSPYDGQFPRGVYDAYPYVCSRELARRGIQNGVDVVAYPGVCLTGPQGMENRYWQNSPWTVDEGAPAACSTETPETIVLALGTNDAANDVASDIFIPSLLSFITRIHHLHGPTLKHIIIILPFIDRKEDGDVVPYELAIRSAVSSLSHNESMISIKAHTITPAELLVGDLTLDGLHPSVAGHLQIGANLAQWLIMNEVFTHTLA